MNRTNLKFKIPAGVALVFFIIFVILYYTGQGALTGPFLTGFFVLLAISFHSHPFFKSFAYTMWIFAAVTVSMYYPEYFSHIGSFDTKLMIVPLLQIIMFGMGSQMSVQDFLGVIKMPKGVLIGIVCQFTIMPIVGISIATVFGFPAEIAAGIVLVGSSPSGLASNVMSFIAKANLALSVTLVAIATILSPLLTPALMKLLAGQYVDIDFWAMMLDIIDMVILPIVAGLMLNAIAFGREKKKAVFTEMLVYIGIVFIKNVLLFKTSDATINEAFVVFLKNLGWFIVLPIVGGYVLKHYAKGSKDILSQVLAFISMLGIGIIITIITAAGRDDLLKIGALLILACLLHNLLGYFLGYWACRFLGLDEKSCRTISLEVGMQNGGLASGLALQMGKVATVGLAPAVFGPMMNITGSSLATWWRGKSTGGEEDENPDKNENEKDNDNP